MQIHFKASAALRQFAKQTGTIGLQEQFTMFAAHHVSGQAGLVSIRLGESLQQTAVDLNAILLADFK